MTQPTVEEARDQCLAGEVHHARGRAAVLLLEVGPRPHRDDLPVLTASASAAGCLSFTVTMSPPV